MHAIGPIRSILTSRAHQSGDEALATGSSESCGPRRGRPHAASKKSMSHLMTRICFGGTVCQGDALSSSRATAADPVSRRHARCTHQGFCCTWKERELLTMVEMEFVLCAS